VSISNEPWYRTLIEIRRYKNIPFYLSSKGCASSGIYSKQTNVNIGYGVFVRDTGKVSFEVQSERTTRVNISVIGEKLEYYIIYGPSPKDIISKYTVLTGRPPVPPAWSYNLLELQLVVIDQLHYKLQRRNRHEFPGRLCGTWYSAWHIPL
jgi:alpha-glucosidase (family GH31 glycosyl hydrolase)